MADLFQMLFHDVGRLPAVKIYVADKYGLILKHILSKKNPLKNPIFEVCIHSTRNVNGRPKRRNKKSSKNIKINFMFTLFNVT